MDTGFKRVIMEDLSEYVDSGRATHAVAGRCFFTHVSQARSLDLETQTTGSAIWRHTESAGVDLIQQL
jgi:hypothetical protein